MARRIEVEIVGDSRSVERAFARTSKSASRMQRDMRGTFKGTITGARSLAGTLTGLGAGFIGVAGAVAVVRASFEEMAQAQKATAQTAAVLRSTGKAAGVTAGEVDQMAESLMQISGVDDEVIQGAENMLLTFTEVRNEIGRGNDVFSQATKAALDMAIALGREPRQAALQLGKALQDPVRGITALRRSGVQFTKAQEKQIKAWVETGQIVRAQKAILREVNREFGGSARALGDTLPGKVNILRESLRNLGGTIAEQLAPKIAETVDKWNEWLQDPENQQRVIDDFTSALEGLAAAFEALAGAIKGTKGAIDDVSGFFERHHVGFLNQGLKESTSDLNDWLKDKTGFNVLGVQAGESTGKGFREGFNKTLRAEHLDQVRHALEVEAARRPPRADQRPPGGGRAARRRGLTAEQRNQFFDARIARQLDRVQDLSLRKQLARLRLIAQEVRARFAATKDRTRRLTLDDKLLEIARQQRDVQAQITDQIKAGNQALKDRADAIKSAVIEKLQARQTNILNRRALADAKEQLRIARQIGGPAGIREALRAVQDARSDILMARAEQRPATLTAGGRLAVAGVTINIHGVTDPAAVANRVVAILRKRDRRTTTSQRGPSAGSHAGPK